jgi:glycosidase
MKTLSSSPWWQTGVIYQIYPRSYEDTSGNGIGDLAGIIDKLEYLSDTLGVDAVWLSPFYPSPMADFGYDVADYTDIHPMFGDLDTFDRLVKEAHQRDLRIIIDLVPNHSSDQHPWFIESLSSRDNPKRDWYVWADAKPDGSPPNNWLSVFGGPAWEWDAHTGQYYLHSFLKEQPDLNWRNPEVKEAIFNVVRFWLDRGVDGFRIDVAHFIMKDPLMRDNPPNESANRFMHKSLGEYDSQIHLYDKGHPDVHQVYRELRTLLDTYIPGREAVSVGEIHLFDLSEWVRYYGENLDEIHLPFNFTLLKVDWNARSVRQSADKLEAALPPSAWPNYVLGNHDEARITTRIGEEQARIAAMLLLTLRGTPTLYYGDEIGMTDVPVPADRQQDPWGIRVPGLSRDPNRTPMQWSDTPNAGFSSPGTSRLWLPLADDYKTTNVERQLKDDTSLLNLYRQLLALRRVHPTLQMGDYQTMEAQPEDCFLYRRTLKDHPTMFIALNFSVNEQRIKHKDQGYARIILSSHMNRRGKVDLSGLTLRPNEGVIIEIQQGE